MSNLDEIERAIILLRSSQDLTSDIARTAIEQAILGSLEIPAKLPLPVTLPSEATPEWERQVMAIEVKEEKTNLEIGQMNRDQPVYKSPNRDRPKLGRDYSHIILEYVNELGKGGLTSTDLQDIVEPQYRHRVSDSLGYLHKSGKIRRVLQNNATDAKGSQRDMWCYYPLKDDK